jgi:hypothetical protein
MVTVSLLAGRHVVKFNGATRAFSPLIWRQVTLRSLMHHCLELATKLGPVNWFSRPAITRGIAKCQDIHMKRVPRTVSGGYATRLSPLSTQTNSVALSPRTNYTD